MKVPFFKQALINKPYVQSIHAAVDGLVSGNSYMVGGQYTDMFERQFAQYLGSNFFSTVSNGLDALELAFEVLSLSEHDEVIVPSHTYIASWLAPLRAGCKLVVAPVTQDNFLMDPKALNSLITPRTKCILPVHLYGNACDMTSILDIAARHNLVVIEDAAQAHGTEFNGQRVGSIGDMTCFSFYPTKNLGALGEAGGIATNSACLHDKIVSYRNYGRDLCDGAVNQYQGSNKRCDEIQAAFLSSKLLNLAYIKNKRLDLINRYKCNLENANLPLSLIDYQPGSSPHLAIILLASKSTRNKLLSYLKTHDIQTSIHYRVPCHAQSFINPNQLVISNAVKMQAQHIADRILSLPLSEVHKPSEVDYVCGKIASFFVSK